ncbi:hypothetical protein HN51_069672, partial [Arachis hypogaea]
DRFVVVFLINGTKPVVIRQVWTSNLESEFALIEQIFPVSAMLPLTQFLGFIHVSDKNCHYSKLPPSYVYKLVKANVDFLKLIQLGLALSNYAGHLPDLATLGIQFQRLRRPPRPS